MRVDAVFRNGRIRTMDAAHPIAHAFAVVAEHIVALDDEAESLVPHARRVVDLGGRPVVPGFNDVHHHLSQRGLRMNGVDLREGAVRNLDQVYQAVATAAAAAPAGAWIYGSGYDQNKIGGHPTALALSRVAPRNPVWLEHVSGHMGVANREAFVRAGYSDLQDVPDVAGGHVERDARGAAIGLIQERAMDLITSVFKPLPLEAIVANIAVASTVAAREGLTSITEPGIGTVTGIGNSALDLHAFLTARERGLLTVRAQVMPYITALHAVDAGSDSGFGLDLGLRTGMGDDWLRLGPVKVLTDGSLIGRSAALTCAYHGSTGVGVMAWDTDELEERLRLAHRLGFRLALHAIGDAAVDNALTILEHLQREHPGEDPRHRIEHFSVATDEQIARAARAGVVPIPQGRFISELGDGVREALGPERVQLAYRAKAFLDAGIEIPGSSDSPVVEASPILGMHDLINRRTASGADFVPAERLTAAQALRAYTVGSAYASKEETVKGRIALGMLADATVLSDDLLTVAPENIHDVTVGATIAGGRITFNDNALMES
jgi:predicted amidohydrolase YtcJ